jgi:alkanesulfonate monooxygenase SsuD/methylene tetrahydromethanopterin reductase-like flavin-dependent oxidoreductase (luciferase family)
LTPRLGISFPTPIPGNGRPVTGTELVETAQRIEALGFHGLWIADCLNRGYFAPDPLIGLAAVAGATRRLELGTCILQVPLWNPTLLARAVLTTSLAAEGRFVLGVGAGSTPDDFEAVGADFDSRFTALSSALPVMQALWRGEQAAGGSLEPWSHLLGGPPVLIGSWGGRWIERAATDFAGWIGSGGKRTWQDVEAAVSKFRSAGGKRAVLVSVLADLDGNQAQRPDDRVHLCCPPDEAARRLRRLGDLGFDDVVVVSTNQSDDHIDALAALTREKQHAG